MVINSVVICYDEQGNFSKMTWMIYLEMDSHKSPPAYRLSVDDKCMEESLVLML